MGIAADTALLLHDPVTGTGLVDATSLPRALAGGVVLELVLHGRAHLEEGRWGSTLVLDRTASSSGGDPLVALAQERLTRPTSPKAAVEKLARHVRDPLMAGLARAGVLRRHERTFLGFVPRSPSWPAVDPGPRLALWMRLHAVLVEGATPGADEAALVALVRAVKAETTLVEGRRRDLRARSRDIAEGDWAGQAVRRAVADVHAAVAATVVAATAASSGS